MFLLNYCLKILKTSQNIITRHFISKVAILLVWSCLFNVCYAQSDAASVSQVQLRVFLEGLIDSRIPLRITGLEQDTTIKLEDGKDPEGIHEVEVTIEELSTQTTITITPEKEGVVSISTTSISLGFPRDGTTTRTATFTLTAENVGGTTVTISVRDNLGNRAEIKIYVVVDPPYPEMVRVPKDPTQPRALSFLMGSLEDDVEGKADEMPQHEVNIPYAFEVGKYEVTRGEFAAFVNDSSDYSPENCTDTGIENNWQNPGFTQTDNHPVVCVSWVDATEYVKWLSDETGHSYRLLTEAEWEYAARAGTTSTYYFGNMITDEQAKFGGTVGVYTVSVGNYPANDWGLYDVHGNAAEWVADCWHPNYGEDGMVDAPTDGSEWATDCTSTSNEGVINRVIRGGSWEDNRSLLRSAARASAVETDRPRDYGFRVALNPLSITSFMPAILLHAGGDIRPTTQVEVSIKEIYTEEDVTMTLRLDEGGDAVVSTPNTITILPDGDSIDRSAAFTLSTTGIAGNTTVTLVVTDGMGYGDEVKIPVVVRPIPPLRITSPMQSSISLRAGGDIKPTTQVKVSIKGIYTNEPVEVSLQLDEDGDKVVEISTTSIAIGPGSLDISVDFDLETTGRAGTTTLTLVVRYDDLENTDTTIKIPVEVRAIPPLRISPREPIFLHVGEGIQPTTQVKVSIKGIYTKETVTMTLQLDEAGDKVVEISTTSIAIGSGSLDRSVDFDLETTDENETGTTTLTLIVRYDNLENTDTTIKIRVVVRPVYPEMVQVPTGKFTMGAPSSDTDSEGNERPQREVNIPYAFEVGKYEVTRGQFAAFVRDFVREGHSVENCASNNWQSPGFEQNDDHPVVCVSWNNAQVYAKWLSRKTVHNYRLLTEAEWEYVARAGTTSTYYFGDTISTTQANYSSAGTVQVGSYDPNEFGLYDVHGNVWEWVEDCWHVNYGGAPTDGSAREKCSSTTEIVRRGGSWFDDFEELRSANRSFGFRDGRSSLNVNGFRIAFTPLEITAPPPDRVELTVERSGEEISFEEKPLEVNIKETYTDIPVEVSLQLDEDGGGVVSISTTSISLGFPRDGTTTRTATFTLTAVSEGNTTATLVAKDSLGNMHTVKIPVVVVVEEVVDVLTSLEMVRVPPMGFSRTFMMGSREGGADDEKPQHEVTIPYDFEVGKYEVTLEQYETFSEADDHETPGCDQGQGTWQKLTRLGQNPNHPVVCVGWNDAQAYVSWLSDLTGDNYRLLTEEEWEYAARAGTTSTYYFGDTISTTQANFNNIGNRVPTNDQLTKPVDSYPANAWGLHNFHGNVWEWVEDCYHNNYDPKILNGGGAYTPSSCNSRVLRGGSWVNNDATDLRSANRFFSSPTFRQDSYGFRIARTIPLQIINYPSEEIDLRVGGGHLATTQVEVVIRKTDTDKPVTVELQLDDDSIVSTGSITLLSDNNVQRTAKFTLSVESKGNTTLTVVVRDEDDNEEEIELRLAAIGGNTTLTVVVRDGDGNEDKIEISVAVEAFRPEPEGVTQ